MVCDICGRSPCTTPSFCAQARAADEKRCRKTPRGRAELEAERKKREAASHTNGGGAQDPAPMEPPKPRYDWRKERVHMKEVRAMRFDPLKFLVPGLIPAEGVTLISSKPKVGKSWLLLDLAISATMDRYTLGDLKATQGDVLYLALEDSSADCSSAPRSFCRPSPWNGLKA
jgi:AAA domain-containing protein